MKRVGLWAAVGIGLFLIGGFSAVDQSSAAGKKTPTCSLATLKGRYIFADAGTLFPPRLRRNGADTRGGRRV